MINSITKIPPKTAFIVRDKDLGIVPLAYWCKKHGVKYNTIQARLWRAGLSGNIIGLVELDPHGEHKHLFRKVMEMNNGRDSQEEARLEGEIPA